MEKEITKPDFWQHPEGPRQGGAYGAGKEKAIKISQKLKNLQEEIEKFDKLQKELSDLKELLSLIKEGSGEEEEIKEKIKEVSLKIKEKEQEAFLSGKYDKEGTILTIQAGAGGREAEDWVAMLLRMYQKYCQRQRFKTRIIDQSFGEAGGPEGRIGIKEITMEIKGNFAFGFLKKEGGIHRLVRISPFSSQDLRHTSFAKVEVIPFIPAADTSEIKIKPEELKIETFCASGPGGQYVNRRETAVRIVHLPTGIVAKSQAERLQGTNRERAMEILMAKLYQFYQEQKEKELQKIKGKKISPSWGNQRRSYVLYPYKLVKDYQTKVETSNIEGVLDGDINQFIEAEIIKTKND